jgi:hypothetical protein
MSQLIACPECAKHLQVPEDLLGKKVQCPECKHTFTAPSPEAEIAAAPRPKSAPPASKAPAWEQKPRNDERDDDDRSERRRRRRDLDDDEDYDRSPRRRRGPRYAPHRGGLILAFGILGLVVPIPIFGPLAWIMGNNDMGEIREGRMDPEGETLTNVGRILGMVSTILLLVGLLSSCGVFGCGFLLAALGAGKARQNVPPRRRF